jgi:phenylacetate-CoA ligase
MGKLRTMAELRRNRSLPPPALQALQARKLRAVVAAARRDVPFYRELYAQAGLEADMPRTLEDLSRLPIVTKRQVRAAGPANLVSQRLSATATLSTHTTGTTGEPLTIPLTTGEAAIRSLVDFRSLLSLGFRPSDRLVVVGPSEVRRPPLHERLGLFRTVVLPSTLSPDAQAREVVRLRPDILWCYSAHLRLLLRHPDRPITRIAPRLIIVSGAVLQAHDQRMAEEQGRCGVFRSYACMEIGRIAIECPTHQGLHVNADHVIMEILHGDERAPAGETGEVVLTALNQFATPFIRYRLGDLTAWVHEPCRCGSTHPLIRPPEGRFEDLLRFRDGRWQTAVPFMHRVRLAEHVDRFQLIQESFDVVRVLIVPTHPWLPAVRDSLHRELSALLPDGVRLDLDLVDRVEESSGKFRETISTLPQE